LIVLVSIAGFEGKEFRTSITNQGPVHSAKYMKI
jgi:hypothetical protein